MYTPSATVVGASGLRSVAAHEPTAAVEERPEPGSRTPRDKVTISAGARAMASSELTPEQQQEVAELRSRDVEVRAHEAAHQAAGGDLAGGASFTFQTGPDGRQYAVGGEVPVELRSGRTPDETIANAQQVRRAALAPADPSAQDLAVAGAASQMESSARTLKAREASETYARSQAGKSGPTSGRPNGTSSPARGQPSAAVA